VLEKKLRGEKIEGVGEFSWKGQKKPHNRDGRQLGDKNLRRETRAEKKDRNGEQAS